MGNFGFGMVFSIGFDEVTGLYFMFSCLGRRFGFFEVLDLYRLMLNKIMSFIDDLGFYKLMEVMLGNCFRRFYSY